MPEEEVEQVEAETPEVEAAAPETDPFEAGEETFARPYVEKIRSEAAEYRTKAKSYEEAFDGYNDDEKAVLLDLARALRTNPAGAAEWMEEVAKNIKGGMTQSQAEAAATQQVTEGQAPAEDRPLTRAELDQILGQKEAERVQRQLIDEVYSDLRGLGLDINSTDPVMRSETLSVMQVAAEMGIDVKDAYKLVVEDRRQSIIDGYLEEVKKGGGTQPVLGAPVSGEREIKSLKDAKLAALERVKNLG